MVDTADNMAKYDCAADFFLLTMVLLKVDFELMV